MHLKQGKNYSASPETIDMTGFFKKSCITTRTTENAKTDAARIRLCNFFAFGQFSAQFWPVPPPVYKNLKLAIDERWRLRNIRIQQIEKQR
jgi:hypothetical protein